MIQGLLKFTGLLVLKIVYGKRYQEEVTDKWKKRLPLMLFLSTINIFWLLGIIALCSGNIGKDTLYVALAVLIYPCAIAAWAVRVRKKYASDSTTDPTHIQSEDQDALLH